MPAFDAVLWDYDGTLIDGRWADEEAVAELLRRDPSAASGTEIFWATEGQPIMTRLQLAWPDRLDEVVPLFNGRWTPRVFPGIKRVLRVLRTSEHRLGVVSSRQRKTLEWGLRSSGLLPFFSVIVSLEDVHSPKPSPEGLLLGVRALGTVPGHAVYIGDSDVDLEAGRRAGITAWRAAWSGGTVGGVEVGGAVILREPADTLTMLAAANRAVG